MSETASGTARVVIVGGGFAGLFAARALGRRTPAVPSADGSPRTGLRRAPGQVTLVDQSEHHLFQPLLYQCATGILSEGQITAPLRRVLRNYRNVDCEMAKVIDIDPVERRVCCVRPLGEEFDLNYDYLIMAAGVEQTYFGHDEFAVWAPGMKTISDALTIRRRVFGSFEMAETATDPVERTRRLTFALVGAGPTGVELAGQIREVATKTLRDEFRQFKPEDARVLLFDGGDAPLASFGPELSRRAAISLKRLGVEMHLGTRVTNVDESGLDVRGADGTTEHYDAATVLWTAGVAAPELATALAKATGAEQDRAGRVVVGDDLTVPGHPEIFVIGDMMSLHKLPGVAEVAMQSGMYAGRRIKEQLRSGATVSGKPFKYRDLGSAAYIARGDAVVSGGPLKLHGLIGWFSWLFIHIAFLTGFRNRVGALLTWWVAFTRDIRRERAFTDKPVGLLKTIYAAEADNPELKRPGPDH
jgi:NADH:ubiquinone reductase (H+-translocating)